MLNNGSPELYGGSPPSLCGSATEKFSCDFFHISPFLSDLAGLRGRNLKSRGLANSVRERIMCCF